MNDPIRIGVVGAGVFGGYHAGKCQAHDRVELIGIYDPDAKAVNAAAKEHLTRAFHNYDAMLSRVDAVIVACPAKYHAQMALEALRCARHVLVEKPIASDLKSAQDMVDIAGLNNCVLQVGHQERFVAKAIGLDRAPENPVKITARRMSPFSVRGTDVSVTQDLMTHDIDMALWLMGSVPSDVDCDSICVRTDQPDAARAVLSFPHGGKAYLEASRVEAPEDRERVMEITYPSGSLKVDFVNKTFENTTGFDFNPDFGDDPIAADSLGAGTNAFIRAVLDGDKIPVTGRDGLEALKVALMIDGDV